MFPKRLEHACISPRAGTSKCIWGIYTSSTIPTWLRVALIDLNLTLPSRESCSAVTLVASEASPLKSSYLLTDEVSWCKNVL